MAFGHARQTWAVAIWCCSSSSACLIKPIFDSSIAESFAVNREETLFYERHAAVKRVAIIAVCARIFQGLPGLRNGIYEVRWRSPVSVDIIPLCHERARKGAVITICCRRKRSREHIFPVRDRGADEDMATVRGRRHFF